MECRSESTGASDTRARRADIASSSETCDASECSSSSGSNDSCAIRHFAYFWLHTGKPSGAGGFWPPAPLTPSNTSADLKSSAEFMSYSRGAGGATAASVCSTVSIAIAFSSSPFPTSGACECAFGAVAAAASLEHSSAICAGIEAASVSRNAAASVSSSAPLRTPPPTWVHAKKQRPSRAADLRPAPPPEPTAADAASVARSIVADTALAASWSSPSRAATAAATAATSLPDAPAGRSAAHRNLTRSSARRNASVLGTSG